MEMGEEKDLIRIYRTEDIKVGIKCDITSKDEFLMVAHGILSLFEEIPELLEFFKHYEEEQNEETQTILSLNQSKIKS